MLNCKTPAIIVLAARRCRVADGGAVGKTPGGGAAQQSTGLVVLVKG